MNGTQKALTIIALGVTLAGVLGAPGQAVDMAQRPANVVAETSVGANRVDWLPTVEYERLALTVTGPKDFSIRQELEAGQPLSLSLFDKNGERLPDGIYTYELRPVPRLDKETREALARARDGGDESLVAQMRNTGRLPEHPLIQSGYLTIRGGSFVATDLAARAANEPRSSALLPTNPGPRKTSVAPPLIVPGNACIGDGCTGDSDADVPVLKLKSSWVFLKFEDVPDGISFSRDWALQANDAIGGSDRFFIWDMDAGTTPFSIAGNAPDSSLYVASNGNLGLGTSTPAKDIHVMSGNTPALRLEQDGSGGLTPRTWDVGADNTNFFVRDVTGSSNQPFRVRAGAPTSSMDIASSGNVGVGTASPSNTLHVKRTDGTAQLLVEEASSTAAYRTLATFKNKGGIQINLSDTSANGGVGVTWAALNSNAQFIVSDVGDATNEMVLDQAGNVTFAGTVTPGSSRTIKEEFSPVDSRAVLRRVLDLPITSWSYKATPGVRHVGPMSEDFYAAFKVGSDDKGISVTDSAGVALAAIQGLHLELAARDAEIAALRARLEELAARLEQLKTTP